MRRSPIFLGLVAAALFGAATPASKALLEEIPPFTLAGLLYLGAALGVLPLLRRQGLRRLGKKNAVRLAGAVGLGGIAGPVLLLFGLRLASAASVSMWLNLELVATAVLGALFFRDHLGARGWVGVAGIVAAAGVLSWGEGDPGPAAVGLVALGCLCWGMDNHFTALIDGIRAEEVTFWKGLVAGGVNLGIGLAIHPAPDSVGSIALAAGVGVFAYGLSIVLYILSAQMLGATRSQMVFASAPFFGVALSALVLQERLTPVQGVAAAVLVLSLLVLFLRNRHNHVHAHGAMEHEHWHRHDDGHHTHVHADLPAATWHCHRHEHEPVTHAHAHWPDLHHRHDH